MDELARTIARLPDANAGETLRYCPGCGLGIVQSALARAMYRLELDLGSVVTVGGSGCYGIMGEYFQSNHIHGSHGRAPAVAVGLKLANPKLTVITIQGDGDALAIGASHFIHAARRNIDITVVIANNFGYANTGGQYGPSTPLGGITETSPAGCFEYPFDACTLAIGAGATFVARSTSYHAVHLTNMLERAIRHKGFSVVEILQHCHVLYGKRNGMPEATQWLKYFKEHTVRVGANTANRQSPAEPGMWDIGVLHQEDKPEFVEMYFATTKPAPVGNGSGR
jgi:2-oxoglutarate ferredoxin oxidoreductase subunit beta